MNKRKTTKERSCFSFVQRKKRTQTTSHKPQIIRGKEEIEKEKKKTLEREGESQDYY